MKFPPRILVIDDDRDSCELMQLMLQYSDASYVITCVLTPEEGLRLAASRNFDLYLLDCRLIGINGIEVCRTLRQTGTEVPIMFFTGEAQQSVHQEALRAGADAYLIKPDDLKNLTGTVKRLLRLHKPARRPNVAAHRYHRAATAP